jgi:hypothetical protein
MMTDQTGYAPIESSATTALSAASVMPISAPATLQRCGEGGPVLPVLVGWTRAHVHRIRDARVSADHLIWMTTRHPVSREGLR